ncbi:3'-5' exoribonuclease YhaM family protein [Candidatus Omnitrophota bacterium]
MHTFIRDLKEGKKIDGVYLVREKSFNTTKKGSFYIFLQLSDRTGMVKANKWDASKESFDSFEVDDFVKISGTVETFKGFPQLKIDAIKKVPEKDLDLSLFVPSTDKNRNDMFNALISEISHINNPYLKTLLNNIFSNTSIADEFKKAPAATDFHHSYLGGLLEHTLSCVELAKMLFSMYPGINRDLLICGAIVHDIGKIEELSYSRSFYYTDKGRLVGHLVLGINMVEKEIDKVPDFPGELKNLILHIILSHHGEHEWGSPKRPMSLEAVVMHHIDNLDAKIVGFNHFAETYSENSSNWTRHSKMFKEFLYKKSMPVYKDSELLEKDWV